MRRLFIELLLPSSIILLLILLDSLLPGWELFHPKKWFILIFFIFTTYTTKKITELGGNFEKIKFHNFYFSSMFVRMILSLIFLFVFVLYKVENVFLFVINFFLCYFFYMIFEIYYLLGNLRANSKQ